MTPENDLLIRLLAQIDALWTPLRFRGNDGDHPAVIFDRRRRFASEGIPWASGQASAGERLQHSKLLGTLESDGLVRRYRPHTGRALGAALTERGDETTRALCGLPSCAEALTLLDSVLVLGDKLAAADHGDMVFIPEYLLGGEERYLGTAEFGKTLGRVEEMLAPLLWRRLVASNSDRQRHVAYSLTASGMALARQRAALPGSPELTPAGGPDGEATALYWDCYHADLQDRESWHDDGIRDIGEIPLPVSLPNRRELRELKRGKTG